jgi:bifunctional glutamyl/prolyl-tRNA synthetase
LKSDDDSATEINEKIIIQGNKVRDLKSTEANKVVIDAEVKTLLSLKNKFKTITGRDWKPNSTSPVKDIPMQKTNILLAQQIKMQNDLVKNLRSQKPDSVTITKEVAKLVELKSKFKNETGKDWVPSTHLNENFQQSEKNINVPSNAESDDKFKLEQEINEQGNKVRELKANKAAKEVIQQEVQSLLALKIAYKNFFGKDYVSMENSSSAPRESKTKSSKTEGTKTTKGAKNLESKKEVALASKESESVKTGTRLGLEAKKNENLSDWYSQVITKGEMIEYYDVSGCYILRPWSFAIWDVLKDFLDKEIKKLGVQNCYFPIFVSKGALEKEKSHIADFAPEVAWVTKSGESDLAEHIAIRPTSETVMYPAYAKWLKSYRDLPLKLNQWNNVVVCIIYLVEIKIKLHQNLNNNFT